MDLAGIAFAFILIVSSLLYFRPRKQRQNQQDSADDYKRLFDDQVIIENTAMTDDL